MQIKAVLFDLDGTLVDSNKMHVNSWQQAFLEIGMTFDGSIIHAQIGKGADMLVPTLLPDVDDATQKKLADAEAHIFKAKYLERVQPFPLARELIRHVHQNGQRVVVATSSSDEQLDYYLGLLQAREIVTATTSASEVKRTKPAPDIFGVALKKLPDISSSEALVVGDTPYDAEAAKKNGLETVALRSGGFSDEDLKNAGAIAIYDNAAALLDGYQRSPLGR